MTPRERVVVDSRMAKEGQVFAVLHQVGHKDQPFRDVHVVLAAKKGNGNALDALHERRRRRFLTTEQVPEQSLKRLPKPLLKPRAG